MACFPCNRATARLGRRCRRRAMPACCGVVRERRAVKCEGSRCRGNRGLDSRPNRRRFSMTPITEFRKKLDWDTASRLGECFPPLAI
eukprot:5241071-Pleurochrysis_carterae.AAC.2